MRPSVKLSTLLRHLAPGLLLLACLIVLVFAPIIPVTAAEPDPTLVFSTYLGGDNNEGGKDIAVDTAGNVYVVGTTYSTNFPATNPLGATTPGIYVTKFDPTGLMQLYSIFLGVGTPYSIAVDPDGAAYVVGYATNIPTVNAIQAASAGGNDAFIAKVNPAGTALVYSTYLGGSGYDIATAVALDSQNNAYVVGATGSTDFPTQNAFQPANEGSQWDVWIARINTAGSALDYSTYYGGSDWDTSLNIEVDSAGNAYITGQTGSNDFPITNAYQSEHANWCIPPTPNSRPCTDLYVAKFSPLGIPIFSTYLGGNGSYERGMGIAIDSTGSVYIAGDTDSSDFPIANAYQPTRPNLGGGFVTKLSPDGLQLIYSTYFGGTTGYTGVTDIAVDTAGNAYLTGITETTDFPTVKPIQAERAPGFFTNSDIFATTFSADGQSLLFSTYWGGSYDDGYGEFGPRIAIDQRNSIHLTGTTTSNDFPTLNAFQSDPGGAYSLTGFPNYDAFLVKIAFPLISFPDEAVERNYFTTLTPTLTWKPVTWALAYHIQVDRSLSFTAPLDFNAPGSADSVVIDLPTNGFYYWRMQVKKPDGSWTAWKVMDSFTIDAD